jgi:hypothetical protein
MACYDLTAGHSCNTNFDFEFKMLEANCWDWFVYIVLYIDFEVENNSHFRDLKTSSKHLFTIFNQVHGDVIFNAANQRTANIVCKKRLTADKNKSMCST